MKKYDVVAKCGEYEQDGMKKARWVTCGVALDGDKGIRVKLNAIPAGNEWDGWFSLKESDRNANREPAKTTESTPSKPTKSSAIAGKADEKVNEGGEAEDNDNLPF